MSLVNCGTICKHYFSVMLRTSQARFHIGLLNKRWFTSNHSQLDLRDRSFYPTTKFKNDLNTSFLDLDTIPEFFNFGDNNSNLNGNQYVSLTKQRQFYTNVQGLAKKANQIACKDCDESFITLLEEYINKKNSEALNLIPSGPSQNEHQLAGDLEIDQENIGPIGNPIIRRPKGRPLGTTRFKGPLEHSSEINKVRKCSLCNESGHNRTTCPMNTNRKKRKSEDGLED